MPEGVTIAGLAAAAGEGEDAFAFCASESESEECPRREASKTGEGEAVESERESGGVRGEEELPRSLDASV